MSVAQVRDLHLGKEMSIQIKYLLEKTIDDFHRASIPAAYNERFVHDMEETVEQLDNIISSFPDHDVHSDIFIVDTTSIIHPNDSL